MTKTLRVVAAVVLFSITNLFVNPASARRMIAQAGSAPWQFQASCFNSEPLARSGGAGVGLINSTPCTTGAFFNSYWMISPSIDTSGTKTVQLTTKQTGANQLLCALFEINRSGTTLQQIDYAPFPAANYGSYVTMSKSITIAASNNLAVVCAFNGASTDVTNARLLSIEY